jgi:addiction module HigA family antidote
MTERTYAYAPSYAFPPGDTLAEVLKSRGIRQADLAERAGLTSKAINEIVKAKARITPTTALQLERVLGLPASFWNNLQRRYDEAQAVAEEAERLGRNVAWAKVFPVRAMSKWGWIEPSRDPVARLRALLNFFGTANPDAWKAHWASTQVAFRSVAKLPKDNYALACWLRRGEVEAASLETKAYDEDLFRQTLTQLRGLTKLPGVEFVEPLVRGCAEAGVAVVFVPELPGTRTYGATRWLSPQKALIQLSLRRKTDDQLWFSFFHEAAHILLHPKKAVFIEATQGTDDFEVQADRFARDTLIPPSEYRAFVSMGDFGHAAVREFANRIGVAPGIVVGRLQHETLIAYRRLNGLKRHYTFAKTAAA